MKIQVASKSMLRGWMRPGLAVVCFSLLGASCFGQSGKPEKLECESLVTPLGMDQDRPLLSWQLRDSREGARQSGYEIQVASSAVLLAAGKADVWDSGRVDSDNSRGVAYAGAPLEPSKRYFWRVLVWDHQGKQYPASDASWWETGLMRQENWKAQWIGYEEAEHRSIRESGAIWITNADAVQPATGASTRRAFRFHFSPAKAVRRAVLYVTGQDTAAAWLNGKQVFEASPLNAWKQMPWKTYTAREVTSQLRGGENVLAVEVIRYRVDRSPSADASPVPMSAVLYLDEGGGSVEVLKSGQPGWKAAALAEGSWNEPGFDDSSWKEAIPCVMASGVGAETGNPWPTGSVKALRHTFHVDKPVASARVYATALGAYKLSLNGHPVGRDILAPGWTDFRQQVVYQAYDVSSQIRQGKNAIGALLAPGWYETPLLWYRQGYNYGNTPPAVRIQMRIVYKDGSVDQIVSDDSWKAGVSPILSAEIYDGETYDARKLQAGWDSASFSETGWKNAEIVQPHEPKIVWQYFQPIRAKQTLTAKSVTSPAAGVYIFDFGQNLSGVARIRTQGSAGTDVQLRYAEILNPDGTLYVENLRTAKATDHFILAGKGQEEYQPSFTYHGFRFVEVSGATSKPALEDMQAVVFHTDAPFTVRLKSGSKMLDQLWSNILWGQRSNFVGVPTDCPQRDERLGWTADAQVFWRAASFNMDLTAFSRKFGADLRGTQVGTDMYAIWAPGTLLPNSAHGTGWSDAGVIIPWTSWIQTGDPEIVQQNWAGMEKYLSAIERENPDYLWKHDYGIPFADWLAPEGVTPVDLVATAYWAYDATLMREMARAAHKTGDEKKYADLFEKIKAAFNKEYVRADGFVGGVPPPPIFASGVDTRLSDKPVETQTGYVLALHMNLLPESLRSVAAQRLVDRIAANHGLLGTGFLGTPYLLGALTDTGHADVAYRLLLNTNYPSWGYLVDHGATTMWERWNGDQMRGDPSMNSYNHYAYGAVADWIYRDAAGIDTLPADPGFHTVLLHPNFDKSLGSLDVSYDSGYGTIRSSWSVSGNAAVWKLTIPPNAKGELPVPPDQKEAFKLDGKPLAQSARIHSRGGENGREVYEVPAGSYQFDVAIR